MTELGEKIPASAKNLGKIIINCIYSLSVAVFVLFFLAVILIFGALHFQWIVPLILVVWGISYKINTLIGKLFISKYSIFITFLCLYLFVIMVLFQPIYLRFVNYFWAALLLIPLIICISYRLSPVLGRLLNSNNSILLIAVYLTAFSIMFMYNCDFLYYMLYPPPEGYIMF